ncbi:hypothetical protein Tco_1251656 [Tanacetum coccineum]
MIRRRTSRFAVKSVPDEKDVQSHDEPVRQEDYDVMIELETEDMERLQARLQRHKQDYFENEQQRKQEQEESHEEELWENEQEEQEESHEDADYDEPISQEDYDVIMELETEDMERLQARLQRHKQDYFENEQQRKQEQEEKQILTDYDEPISQEDYDVIMELETEDMERLQARLQRHKQEHILFINVSRSVNIGSTNSFIEETANVSLSLGQGCADDSVGPSIEVNSNLVPNGPPSSMTFNQAQVACLVGLVEPIENPVLNGARIIERSNESVPNRNSPIVDEGENVIQDDPELDTFRNG